MRKEYNLGFISDEDIFRHVQETVRLYKSTFDWKNFHEKVINPIKYIYESPQFDQIVNELIENANIRKIDQAKTNIAGNFHRNIFRYVGDDWKTPVQGTNAFDLVNPSRHLYIKFTTTRQNLHKDTLIPAYITMQQQVLDDNQSLCLLVDPILGEYTNRKWEMTVDKVKYAHDAIRQVSIDHFYALALNDRMPFFRLLKVLPQVVDDVIEEEQRTVLPEAEEMEPTVFSAKVLHHLFLL